MRCHAPAAWMERGRQTNAEQMFNYQRSVLRSLEISAPKCRYFTTAYASDESWSSGTAPTIRCPRLPTCHLSRGLAPLRVGAHGAPQPQRHSGVPVPLHPPLVAQHCGQHVPEGCAHGGFPALPLCRFRACCCLKTYQACCHLTGPMNLSAGWRSCYRNDPAGNGCAHPDQGAPPSRGLSACGFLTTLKPWGAAPALCGEEPPGSRVPPPGGIAWTWGGGTPVQSQAPITWPSQGASMQRMGCFSCCHHPNQHSDTGAAPTPWRAIGAGAAVFGQRRSPASTASPDPSSISLTRPTAHLSTSDLSNITINLGLSGSPVCVPRSPASPRRHLCPCPMHHPRAPALARDKSPHRHAGSRADCLLRVMGSQGKSQRRGGGDAALRQRFIYLISPGSGTFFFF